MPCCYDLLALLNKGMAKPHAFYICSACGAVHNKWSGKCEACGEWNTISQEAVSDAVPKGLKPDGKARKLETVAMTVEMPDAPRKTTGIGELDRVLGGGLVEGSAILIGGDPGIGKSTLLLQAVAECAKRGVQCLYISGEESVAQVSLRARRLGLAQPSVQIAASSSVRDIVASLESGTPPGLVVIDSIQTMYIDNIEAAPGSVSQVRAASHELIRVAKKRGFTLFLVGHVTKDGQIAGPRVLEHMVDTVLYFEGERGHAYRILRGVKNRFGATDEIGVFEMVEEGLKEVPNPSALFIAGRHAGASGSAVFAGMEGSRPILVEMQALVAPSFMSTPRRAVVGWDSNRLAMLLAVLETRAGLRFADKEVYLSVAGGLKVADPAADLAAAFALASALSQEPLPMDTVYFGEVGLSGEIRPVARAEARLKEAEKLGFARAYCRVASIPKQLTLTVETVETVLSLASRK